MNTLGLLLGNIVMIALVVGALRFLFLWKPTRARTVPSEPKVSRNGR